MTKKQNDWMCPRCRSSRCVKNGHVFGWQRRKCKACGYQFTKPAPKGKPLYVFLNAHMLYMFGLSMRTIARIVGVSAQSVSRWIKKWHQAFMFEAQSGETFFKTTQSGLLKRLDVPRNAALLVSSRALPSGAKIHVVVQLPPNYH